MSEIFFEYALYEFTL